MKTIHIIAAMLLAAALSIVSFGSTDPFGAQSALSRLTSADPRIAYAVSPSIVDGYQPSAENVITWHQPGVASVSRSEMEIKLAREDRTALCASPSQAIKSHPSYSTWCP